MKLIVCALLLLLATAANALNIYETLQTQSDMTTLVSLIDGQPAVKARLESTDDTTTLFAPTNGAITSALNAGFNAGDSPLVLNTLLYHAVNGKVMSTDLSSAQAVETLATDGAYVKLDGDGQVLIITVTVDEVRVSFGLNSGVVVEADINADNAVIHKVNSLLLLPSDVVTTGTAAGLTSLLDAVIAADLVDTLLGVEGLTVFAPTNDAFAALGIDVTTLPEEDLREILLYHVVASPIYAPNLESKQKVRSLQGDYLTVRVENGGVTIDGVADVVVADALIKNGNVHVIDAVLLPSEDSSAGTIASALFATLLVAIAAALF